MPSTFFGLNIGTSGLNMFQTALNTTAHNIANADTEGYSRQEVIKTAADAMSVNARYGMAGNGVSVESINQIRNTYYDTKYWSNSAIYGEYNQKNDYLLQIENYFNEMTSESGFTKVYTQFTNALNQLAGDPSDTTKRSEVISYADSFATMVNEISTNLSRTQKSANDEIAINVNQINAIAQQIYNINNDINNIEIRGLSANDLRDQRALLVDKLSSIANVEIQETPIYANDGTKSGGNNYSIKINGYDLVNQFGYNQLKVVPREEKVNQSDIDGLYDVYFVEKDGSLGIEFNLADSQLTGNLKGLADVRDGNNSQNFAGTISAVNSADGTKLDSVTVKPSGELTVNTLNLTPQNGLVSLGGREFKYDSFTTEFDGDGNVISVTFEGLMEKTGTSQYESPIVGSLTTGKNASVGDSIAFKGIAYYQAQLNQFVRTLSENFNNLHTSGVDANGDAGLDFLGAARNVDGEAMNLTASKTIDDTATTGTYNSKSDAYSNVTAANWAVNKELLKDNTKLVVATADEAINGVEFHSVLDAMIAVSNDANMFKQGSPSQYLTTLVAELGIDTKSAGDAATYQNNIVNSISTQRLSESSVDTNEEAQDLVKFQRGYELNAKVISVMNEVLNTLINSTGV